MNRLWLKLRSDEEGQTLVLAAIFGLVLMLCVLGTVNLGRAVYDKVQLQTAADSAAYSQAAVEARVLNFTAYTNRAMVVHYASIMAATSYLTWVHMLWVGLKPLLTVLQVVPYVGAVVRIVLKVLQVLVQILDWGLAILTPLISAANLAIYTVQESAWYAAAARLLGLPAEAQSGAPKSHPYQPIRGVSAALGAMNVAVFSKMRGHVLMPQNSLDSVRILFNSNSNQVQQARLHMLEIANSARQPWVAYGGDDINRPVIWPTARHWRIQVPLPLLNCAKIGGVARTELGGFQPAGGINTVTKLPAQIWSGDRFQVITKCWWPIGHHHDPLLTYVTMDQLYALVRPKVYSYVEVGSPKGLLGKLLTPLMKAIQAGLKATKPLPNPDVRLFAMSPYVSFEASARAKPGLLPKLGNFGQPDVVVGLSKPGKDYNAELGAQKYFGRKFSFNGKAAGTGKVDFNFLNRDDAIGLSGGLNAFSAAQAYYHRPGEWKEQPNFFNPLWGARLMPVLESNVAAAASLNRIPFLSTFLKH